MKKQITFYVSHSDYNVYKTEHIFTKCYSDLMIDTWRRLILNTEIVSLRVTDERVEVTLAFEVSEETIFRCNWALFCELDKLIVKDRRMYCEEFKRNTKLITCFNCSYSSHGVMEHFEEDQNVSYV